MKKESDDSGKLGYADCNKLIRGYFLTLESRAKILTSNGCCGEPIRGAPSFVNTERKAACASRRR